MNKNIFFLKNPSKILIELSNSDNDYAADLEIRTGISRANISKIIDQLSDLGLTERHKHGRKSMIIMTKKGQELQKDFLTLQKIYDGE